MTDRSNSPMIPKGLNSLKTRIELLERELASFMETSVEKRVIMRLLPVLNQALVRYVDVKIQRAVVKDRILQAFVPALAQLNENDPSDWNAYRVLLKLRDYLVQSTENENREELLERLEIAQLKARDDQKLAEFLKAILSHHVVYNLFMDLHLLEAIEPDFRPARIAPKTEG